jgi:tRNA A58 N-methylase Trm61
MNPSNSVNQSILLMIKIDKCKKVLEAGSGAGLILPYLMTIKPVECEYFATEFSGDMLSIYKKNVAVYQKKQDKSST